MYHVPVPFAGYTDFADCVRRNADKGDPEAYCAVIMRRVEKARLVVVDGHPIALHYGPGSHQSGSSQDAHAGSGAHADPDTSGWATIREETGSVQGSPRALVASWPYRVGPVRVRAAHRLAAPISEYPLESDRLRPHVGGGMLGPGSYSSLLDPTGTAFQVSRVRGVRNLNPAVSVGRSREWVGGRPDLSLVHSDALISSGAIVEISLDKALYLKVPYFPSRDLPNDYTIFSIAVFAALEDIHGDEFTGNIESLGYDGIVLDFDDRYTGLSDSYGSQVVVFSGAKQYPQVVKVIENPHRMTTDEFLAAAVAKRDDGVLAPDKVFWLMTLDQFMALVREAALTGFAKRLVTKHYPGGQDHDQSEHGNWSQGPKPEYTAGREERERWDTSIAYRVTMGDITPAEAEALGWYDQSNGEWAPLPSDLYHVSTGASAVRASGLMTRAEMGMGGGRGLGGGTSEYVSFTDDPALAAEILEGVREARQVARGEITVQDMIDQATKGVGAKRPFLDDILKSWGGEYETGKTYPQGLQDLLAGQQVEYLFGPKSLEKFLASADAQGNDWDQKLDEGAGEWQPGQSWTERNIEAGNSVPPHLKELWDSIYVSFHRPMTATRLRRDAFDLYKNFSFFRERAGGRTDPLFFSTDVEALAATEADDIQLLHFQPVSPQVMGAKMGGLSEWRVATGHAVRLVDDVVKHYGPGPHPGTGTDQSEHTGRRTAPVSGFLPQGGGNRTIHTAMLTALGSEGDTTLDDYLESRSRVKDEVVNRLYERIGADPVVAQGWYDISHRGTESLIPRYFDHRLVDSPQQLTQTELDGWVGAAPSVIGDGRPIGTLVAEKMLYWSDTSAGSNMEIGNFLAHELNMVSINSEFTGRVDLFLLFRTFYPTRGSEEMNWILSGEGVDLEGKPNSVIGTFVDGLDQLIENTEADFQQTIGDQAEDDAWLGLISNLKNLRSQAVAYPQTLDYLVRTYFAPEVGPENAVRNFVNHTLSTWARSAANSTDSMMFQMAVADRFGLPGRPGEGTDLSADSPDWQRFRERFAWASPRLLDSAVKQFPTYGEAYKKVADAMYEETQDRLTALGIPDDGIVTLFRGMKVSDPWAKAVRIVEHESGTKVGLRTAILGNPIASWTVDPFTASEKFAVSQGGFLGGNRVGVTMVTRVPKESIFSTALSGSGALHEFEVLVLDDYTGEDEVIAYTGSSSRPYPWVETAEHEGEIANSPGLPGGYPALIPSGLGTGEGTEVILTLDELLARERAIKADAS